MKTHRQTIKICFQIIFLSLLAVSSVQASEPSYNGKPLSEWLFELGLSSSVYESSYHPQPGEPAPAEAIRQIGTNAIPELLDILGATGRSKEWVLGRAKSKVFRDKFHNKNVPLDDLQDTAVQGFGVLGTNAVSAVPKISKLLRQTETAYAAAAALTELGPEGFAALTNGMSDKDLAGVVVWTIGHKGGGDVQTLTRLLMDALKSPDWSTRGNAAMFLGGKDATLAVPALISMLDDSAYYPRERAALALSSFGSAAEAAVPKLLSLYTNSWVPEYMWTLKAIDTNAAAEAEQLLVNSGPLNKARDGYSRTKLTNGLELIAGGVIHTEFPKAANHTLSSAELLDPITGKWTETGEMNAARYGHTATLQPNGKVLVTGGYESHGMNIPRHALSSGELYDPATGTWTVVTNK
jgi:hypothetical protein